MMHRHGFVEETYFTWGYIPVREENGDVGGVLARILLEDLYLQ